MKTEKVSVSNILSAGFRRIFPVGLQYEKEISSYSSTQNDRIRGKKNNIAWASESKLSY